MGRLGFAARRSGRLPVSVHDAPGQDRNGTAVQLMESTLGHDSGQAVEQCVVRDFNFQEERTRGKVLRRRRRLLLYFKISALLNLRKEINVSVCVCI